MSESQYLLSCAQSGLLRPISYRYGTIFTIVLNENALADITDLILNQLWLPLEDKQSIIIGFEYSHIHDLTKLFGASDLIYCNDERWYPQADSTNRAFVNSQYDIYISIVEKTVDQLLELRRTVLDVLSGNGLGLKEIVCGSRTDQKILGGRFIDGIENPQDPLSFKRHVLVNEGPLAGSTFGFIQEFSFQWGSLSKLTDEDFSEMIGREVENQQVLGSNDTINSHVERMRYIKQNGQHYSLLRLSMPIFHIPEEDLTDEDTIRAIWNDEKLTGPKVGTTLVGIGDNFTNGRSNFENGLYFQGFSDKPEIIVKMLNSMSGATCKYASYGQGDLLNHVTGKSGGYFWVPSETQFIQYTESSFQRQLIDPVVFPIWDDDQSKNESFFYNTRDWMARMTTGDYPEDEIPHEKVLNLCSILFGRWRSRWYKRSSIVRLPHLYEVLFPEKVPKGIDLTLLDPPLAQDPEYLAIPINVRRGLAIKEHLRLLATHQYGNFNKLDSYRIFQGEIIVGSLEEYSQASGKLVMEYLGYGEERDNARLATLSEASVMGHVVGDYSIMLRNGIQALLDSLKEKYRGTTVQLQKDYYKAGRHALKGLRIFILQYAHLALVKAEAIAIVSEKMKEEQCTDYRLENTEFENLLALHFRCKKLAVDPAWDFVSACQLFFFTHSAIHMTGNPVSMGRIDQILHEYYVMDPLYQPDCPKYFNYCQAVIDALCIKWNEKAVFAMSMIPDVTIYGNTAVNFGTGPFAQGDSSNQWYHQMTLGGYKAEAGEPQDACNDITIIFLRSLRRLPFTAPCLSLRVNSQTPERVLAEATKTILSGGAHPILFHDDRITTAIYERLVATYQGVEENSIYDNDFLIANSRNVTCDGCYEPMIMGGSEFSFTYVNLLESIECALNTGASIQTSGPEYLRGSKIHWNSVPAENVKSFEHFLDITIDFHLKQQLLSFYSTTLNGYGALKNYSPSPFLSLFMHNSMERGRDLTEGGCDFHIVTAMLVAFSNFVDSLFAIKKLVFDRDTAVTTLGELRNALMSNWGEANLDYLQLVSPNRILQTERKYKRMRNLALSLPKFGGPDSLIATRPNWTSNQMVEFRKEVTELGNTLIDRIVALTNFMGEKVFSGSKMEGLEQTYSDPEFPFRFTVCPGSGTFENYVACGLGLGASADGRLSGQPIASDLSPTPIPVDLPTLPLESFRGIFESMKDYQAKGFHTGLANAGEIDMNLNEEFPEETLLEFIRGYANASTEDSEFGASNLLTFTLSNPDTYLKAVETPQQYDLIRVRMGGWSDFFISQWPLHQNQHMRRPYFLSDSEQKEE